MSRPYYKLSQSISIRDIQLNIDDEISILQDFKNFNKHDIATEKGETIETGLHFTTEELTQLLDDGSLKEQGMKF